MLFWLEATSGEQPRATTEPKTSCGLAGTLLPAAEAPVGTRGGRAQDQCDARALRGQARLQQVQAGKARTVGANPSCKPSLDYPRACPAQPVWDRGADKKAARADLVRAGVFVKRVNICRHTHSGPQARLRLSCTGAHCICLSGNSCQAESWIRRGQHKERMCGGGPGALASLCYADVVSCSTAGGGAATPCVQHALAKAEPVSGVQARIS